MSEKHTPGPWHITERPDLLQPLIIFGPEGTRRDLSGLAAIATVNGILEEDRANARLIAAAPELLDACIKQHEVIDALLARLIGLDEKFMPSKSPYWPVVEQGHAVIAKARGQ